MNSNLNSSSSSKRSTSGGGAFFVALGIFLSRIAGLVREKVFAHYLGNSLASDAFRAALKIPNFLQNILGEGVLSASFIPVYAQLKAQSKSAEADLLARAVGSALFLLTTLLTLGGITASPYLIALIAPGFEGEQASLTLRLVQIFFPGMGLLVMSAWCLGILNSHRKFFLSYVAPVASNLAIIASIFYFGPNHSQESLVLKAAWGLVVGAFLQLAVQVPSTLKLLASLKPTLNFSSAPFRSVLKAFFPVTLSRGVVQISAYIDNIIASFMPLGAVSALGYAQTIYLLPISLFGMSVSAAELPQMSSAQGSEIEISNFLRERLIKGLRQIAFFVVPTSIAFMCLGDQIIALLYQSGQFKASDTLLVWSILVGSSIGLLAGTQGRLFTSTFYALKDTKTPLRFAIIRVSLSSTLGLIAGLWLPKALNIDPMWGTAFLTTSFGISGWTEYLLLRSRLQKRIGKISVPKEFMQKIFGAALMAGIAGWGLKLLLIDVQIHVRALLTLVAFGITYFIICSFIKIPELDRYSRKFKIRSTK